MSSNGVNAPDYAFEDVDIKRGFTIVGIVLIFLATLVFIRFGCNLCIDFVILGDSDSITRALSKIRRFFCPWWHPRTQPQSTSPTSDENAGIETVAMNMDRLLSGLTPVQKSQLLASVLKTKAADEDDFERLRTREVEGALDLESNEIESNANDESKASSHGNEVVCPICIHEITAGNEICLNSCGHFFHRDCLIQWLITHTRLCPYCRTEVITQEMLEEAYRLKQQSRGNCG